MAKKKPNHKNVRQGQTIYMIDRHYDKINWPPEIRRYFIYSQKEPCPALGEMIVRLPVNYLKLILLAYGNKNFFYTRKQALRAL